MKAILKAPVDLLFFGGIGTYVRASSESDEAAGDRANDADPRHRRRSALQGDRRGRQSRHDPARPHRGGAHRHRLNTDAIDNSAGVNTSDVEVNIKIALSRAGARRRADARSAQRAARRDDRRGRAAGAAQQLSADAGAVAWRSGAGWRTSASSNG